MKLTFTPFAGGSAVTQEYGNPAYFGAVKNTLVVTKNIDKITTHGKSP